MKKLLSIIIAICSYARALALIKLACIGDSITYGFGYDVSRSYPSKLDSMLGRQWYVENFGVTGATMVRNGDYSYHKLKTYTDAKKF